MVVIHSSPSPYFTKREGPINHSPPPIVPPRAMMAGPKIINSFFGVICLKGSGKSLTSKSGPQPPGTLFTCFSSAITSLLFSPDHSSEKLARPWRDFPPTLIPPPDEKSNHLPSTPGILFDCFEKCQQKNCIQFSYQEPGGFYERR